jgi:hypothetical protein
MGAYLSSRLLEEQGGRGEGRLRPLRGGQTPPPLLARRSEGGSPRPRACFRPPKEAEFASDFPSLKDRLTVSGGFAHARGACLLSELNFAPAFQKRREKIGCAGEGKEKGQRQEAEPPCLLCPLPSPLLAGLSPLLRGVSRFRGVLVLSIRAEPASKMPFFAPYLASEGLLRAKRYSDSPPSLRRGSEAKYDESPNSISLAKREQATCFRKGCVASFLTARVGRGGEGHCFAPLLIKIRTKSYLFPLFFSATP